MKKVTLHPAERNNYKRFYDMADGVYEIRNEDGTQIGLLFLSFYVDNLLWRRKILWIIVTISRKETSSMFPMQKII